MRVVKVLLISLLAVGALGLLFLWMLMPPDVAVPSRTDRMIAGVTVWNPGNPALPKQTIIIKNGLIAEIRGSKVSDDATLCNGCLVMPGLIDAHVHFPPQQVIGNQRLFSLLYLKYGVTSVRDTGDSDSSIAGLAKSLNGGEIAGPRMYRCGPVLDGDPPGWPSGKPVRNAREGATAVDELAAQGVDCIKTYDETPRAAFEAIAHQAAAHRLPLLGHVSHNINLKDVRDFEVQHFTGFAYTKAPPPRNMSYSEADLIAMTPQDIADVIKLMKAQNIAILPTLANEKQRLTASDADRFPPTLGAVHLPQFWSRVWPTMVGHPNTEPQIQETLAVLPVEQSIIKQAHLRGIDILAGTDTLMPWVVPGESLHLELEALSRAFGSNEDALNAATAVNGRHIDVGKVGVLKVGAVADMLIFRADPRRNLRGLRDWQFLIVSGRMYNRQDVDKAVDRYDQHFNGTFYRTVMGWVVAAMTRSYAHDSQPAKGK